MVFTLPEIDTAEDAANAARSVLKSIASGDVIPLEAASIMAILEQFRRTLETTELDRRISALEERQ